VIWNGIFVGRKLGLETFTGVLVRPARAGKVACAAGWLAVVIAAGLAVAAGGTGVKVL
jgi:hypothetical protein